MKSDNLSEGDKRRIENIFRLFIYYFSERKCSLFLGFDIEQRRLEDALIKTFKNNFGYSSTLSIIMNSIELDKESDTIFTNLFMEGKIVDFDNYSLNEFSIIEWMIDKVIRVRIKYLEKEVIKYYYERTG